MINMGKKSKLEPQEVITNAVKFFGPSGVGLEVINQSECCAEFKGAGGYVRVDVENGTRKNSDVTVMGREFDFQIRQFVGKL